MEGSFLGQYSILEPYEKLLQRILALQLDNVSIKNKKRKNEHVANATNFGGFRGLD